MRLSTAQIFQNGIETILARQTEVNTLQLQLSSGKKVNAPSDDPAAAAQILRLNSELTRVDQYQENADSAESQLQFEEGIIDSSENALQRIRELVIQANNGTQSNDTRAVIAIEIQERLSEVMDLANSQSFNGEYVFSGFQINSIPFSMSSGTVVYAGDDGQRFAQIGATSEVAVGDSGADVFMRIPSGNGDFVFSADPANSGGAQIGSTSADTGFISDTYNVTFAQPTATDPITYTVTDSGGATVATGTYEDGDTLSFAGATLSVSGVPEDGDSFLIEPSSSQDVFTSIDQIITALYDATESASDQARLGTELALSLENIDRAMTHFSEARTAIGSRLNRIESQRDNNADFTLQLQSTLSTSQDLDYTQAISQLNLQLTALEAAQQSYVSAQSLSLFNYI